MLWIVGGVLLAASVSVALGIWLIYFPPIGENHRQVSMSDLVVALTYDDGPNPPYTESLVDMFDRHSVKATFFMMGRHAELHPDTVRRVLAGGHQIGNHSYGSATLAFRSPSFIRAEIHRTDEILRKLGVPKGTDVRAPHVAPFLTVAWILSQEGLRHIGANVVPQDWSTNDADLIARRVLEEVSPGSIVMFHDGLDTEDGIDRQATVDATAEVVRVLKERGYRFTTVDELLTINQKGEHGSRR